MVWAKFDDNWDSNPKMLKLPLEAVGLDSRGITWACRNLSDGYLDISVVKHLAGVRNWKKITDSLVTVGRWEIDDKTGGYWIHDFLEYNPSREQVAAQKDALTNRGKRGASARWKKEDDNSDAKSMQEASPEQENLDAKSMQEASPKLCPDPTRPGLKIKEVFKESKDSLNPSWETQEIDQTNKNPDPVRKTARPNRAARTPEEGSPAPQKSSTTGEVEGKPRKPRILDLVFEAIVEVCKIDRGKATKSEFALVGKSRAELKEKDATAEEVYRKAGVYHRMFPGAMLTPMALVKHWSRLEEENIPKTKAQLNEEDLERTFERLTGGMPVSVLTMEGRLGGDDHVGGIAPSPLSFDNHVSAVRDRAQVAERVESATPFTLATDTHKAQTGDSVASNGAKHGFRSPACANPPNRSTEPLVGKPVYIPVTNPPNGSLAFQHGVDPYDRPAPESNEAAAPRSQANAGNAAKSAISELAKQLSPVNFTATQELPTFEPDWCDEPSWEPDWSDADIESHRSHAEDRVW